MTRILQLARGAAAWCRKPGGVPFLVLAGMAAVSVALACLGAEGALAWAKGYAVGVLAGLAVLSAVVCSRMTGRPALLALHFGFALVLFSGIREKLAYADPPRCFRGIAIALVTGGLLSLAFMGFSGLVKLPY